MFHKFRRLQKRIATLISSMTGLLGIYEAKRLKELTNLGMLFLPLAFTSGLFSMSGSYAPGGTFFWMYWVVAGPLVLLMFLAVFGLNLNAVLMNPWLLKMRLRKRFRSEDHESL